ncbi:hypothetical protein GALMADRAFT_220457 [Galerina marginata CBS 339.88]|uniref:Uncharacterized protein n=1 Tax=Galerina marginata (strain CBS 339.88) TaxID=685588 RepID=A0A067TRE4_GALM3|nr:hypothetical protein GALMADRAFT_220457 [Galerina marginata CBS 339.88]
MDLMASVSRSSGLEKDGDEYVSSTNHILAGTRKDNESTLKRTFLSFSLREGVASSARQDAFALEVYETSLYLSAIFESPKQTISVIPHLFPPRTEHLGSSKLPLPSIHSVLISLLHHIVASYPSQSTYYQQLESIPTTLLPRKSEASKWLASLTKCLRTRNYAKFAGLSQEASIKFVLVASLSGTEPKNPLSPRADPDKGLEAVLFLLDALRRKAADTTWNVVRSAYRELSCDQASAETKSWLSRTMCLESVLDHELSVEAEHWLVSKVSAGHVRRKEGVEGRWIVCKVR